MYFFVGLHQPSDAQHFQRSFISVNRLRRRKSGFKVKSWIMDCAGFTELSIHGRYRHSVRDYAEQIDRWSDNGEMLAAVSQDYMCEPFMLTKTGLSIQEHQRLTIERYDELQQYVTCCYIMPVLQGYSPDGYARHLEAYNCRLAKNMWVGVGSICKRNSSPDDVYQILSRIKSERPDLRLHGFGLKTTSLADPRIRSLLHSADSMAWSYAARREGRDANSWREAKRFVETIEGEKMSDKHQLEQFRELFLSRLEKFNNEDPEAHNAVVAHMDRAISQLLMGVAAEPVKNSGGLTRGQKAAKTRAANKRKKKAAGDNDEGESHDES